MKIKTFVQPIVSFQSRKEAFKKLDEEANNLGDVIFHNVQDKEYPRTFHSPREIARIVIYEEKKETKGG